MRNDRVVSLVLVTALVAVVAATATGAPHQSLVSPETFARVASGVGLIEARRCDGSRRGSGTGFLVGSQVLMTASHVIGMPRTGQRACRIRVLLGDRWYEASLAKAWYDGRSSLRNFDLATLKLSRPAPGHVFAFASALPARGSIVALIGYPLGYPRSFHQGTYRRSLVTRGVPTLVVRVIAEAGMSGGPIIDKDGRVLGFASRVTYPEERDGGAWGSSQYGASIDFVRWWGTSVTSDLCRAYPRGGIPDCPGGAASAQKQWITLRPSGR